MISPTIGTAKREWRVLTGFSLKMIGIVLMVFDHVHQMFYMYGVPEWFNWLGRPVAPIFLFLCAEGFYYTRSRKRYMFLLFAGFTAMNVISTLLTIGMWLEDVALINNIFGTLLVSAYYMLLSDILRKCALEKRLLRMIMAVLGMIVPIIVGLLPLVLDMPIWLKIAMLRFIPSPIVVEGGFVLVSLGVAFYLFRNKLIIQLLAVLASGAIAMTGGGAQWLMVFAIIPIAMYNGHKGWGGKYFFYVFYPAHIYALYILAWLLN